VSRAERAQRAYVRYVLWACAASAGILTVGMGIALEKMTALMVAGGVLFGFGVAMTVRSAWQYLSLARAIDRNSRR
jgi:hypothetical protein